MRNLFNVRVNDLSMSPYFIVDAGNLSKIKEADRGDASNRALMNAFTRTLKLVLTPVGD